jgi:NADPH:quinone reductase-like Zn-dependent oxidoreductase
VKSIVFAHYGNPDVLSFAEVDRPVPRSGEVLVRIHAASINSWDWELLHAVPFANRAMFGLFRPKRLKTLGLDIAGTVEGVGADVTRLQVGDDVFGDLSACAWGGFAENVAAPETALSRKPPNLTFQQAAAVPQAGLLAWQGLVDEGHVAAGQKVLINGASGGSGAFAVQIAKVFGAEVTGVCSGAKMDFVRSLGADHVLDYRCEDFTRSGDRYDLIIDAHAQHSIFANRRALARQGIYVVHGGTTSSIMQVIVLAPLLLLFSRKKMRLLMHKANQGLEELGRLLESGQVVPTIDRVFPFSETIEALEYYGAGHARGKVVISMEQA